MDQTNTHGTQERGYRLVDFDMIFTICDIKVPRMTKRQRANRAIEEMAELTVELQHLFRQRSTAEAISKEVAQALITILYLSDLYDVEVINEELERQLRRWEREYKLKEGDIQRRKTS